MKAVIFMVFLLVLPVLASAATYTPSTETTCVGKTCTQTIYSGIRFADEKGTKIEDAKSLKGVPGIMLNIKRDANFPVDVLDYNSTHITLRLNVTSSQRNKDIPIQIFDTQNTSKLSYNTTFRSSAVTYSQRTIAFGFAKTLKFGFNSTTITLNESNSGNVGDTQTRNSSSASVLNYGITTTGDVRDYTTTIFGENQRWYWIMWNMNAIPANSTINNVNFSLNVTTVGLNTKQHVVYNTSLWNSTGQGPWVEGNLNGVAAYNIITRNLTFQNQPAQGTLQDNKSVPSTQYIRIYWNVTNAAINAYANSTNKNMSLVVKGQYNADSAGWVSYGTKENADVNTRPQLTVTYTAGGAPPAGNSCNCTTIAAGTPITCSDNCDLAACDANGQVITFTGAGTITTSGNVVNFPRAIFSGGCKLVIGAGKRWG